MTLRETSRGRAEPTSAYPRVQLLWIAPCYNRTRAHSPVVRQPSRVQIRSFHYTIRSEFSQNQILHFLPDFRIVFHFRVSFAKDLLVPWDRRDIDSFFTVVELEIAKDGRPQRIFSDDGSLSSDQNTVSLKETGSTRHVGRDASISSSYAVNLDRQKDWYTQLV